MSLALLTLAGALLAIWFVVHVLYVGPMEAPAAEITLVWVLGIAALGLVVAAVVLLGLGRLHGRTRPAWLRFVRLARDATAAVGAALVIVGLLHYRDTEPHGDILWVVLGVVVLVGSGLVHWSIVRARRNELT
jgi:O-antigen/teichoic acid export membrane protein